MTVICAIGFQSFKAGLRILKHASRFIESYACIAYKSAFFPYAAAVITDIAFVGGTSLPFFINISFLIKKGKDVPPTIGKTSLPLLRLLYSYKTDLSMDL